MYNFQFIVLPKSTVVFVDNKSQIQLKNITTQRLGYKIRTTNNVDYKVMDSKGIIMPQEVKIIGIVCVSHTKAERVKFQIITTLLSSNDNSLSNSFMPFDFDGKEFIILEYLHDLQIDSVQVLDEPKAEVVSFIKFYGDDSIIYIENDSKLSYMRFWNFNIYFMNSLSSQAKFEKWIKIRIGEPITAFDSDQNNAIFGSISGYVGFYQYETQELKYIPDVFEELVRGIYIEPLKTYIVIGDSQGLIMDNQTRDFKSFKFDRPHNANICSSTLSLCYKTKVLLLSVAPTQNKDIGVDISTKKNSLYVYDLFHGDQMSYFVDMPHLQVPFHYNGNQLLMLEYLKGGKKKLSLLTFDEKPSIQILHDIDQKVEFISHCKLFEQSILFVENHKILKKWDNNAVIILKIMKNQIMGLDLNEQMEISLLDYEGNVIIMLGENEICNFNIFKIPNFPIELIKHRYLFDMGYPYYIRKRGNKVLISSDLGILIFTLLI